MPSQNPLKFLYDRQKFDIIPEHRVLPEFKILRKSNGLQVETPSGTMFAQQLSGVWLKLGHEKLLRERSQPKDDLWRVRHGKIQIKEKWDRVNNL